MEDMSAFGNNRGSPGPSDRRPTVDSRVAVLGTGPHPQNMSSESSSRSGYYSSSSYDRSLNYLDTTHGHQFQYQPLPTDLKNSGYSQGVPMDFSGRPCFPGMPSSWNVLAPAASHIQQPSCYGSTDTSVNERSQFAFQTASRIPGDMNEVTASVGRDRLLWKDLGSRHLLSERCDVSGWAHTGSMPTQPGRSQKEVVDSRKQSVRDKAEDVSAKDKAEDVSGKDKGEDVCDKGKDKTDKMKHGSVKGTDAFDKSLHGINEVKEETDKIEDRAEQGTNKCGIDKGKDMTDKGKDVTNKGNNLTDKGKDGTDRGDTDEDNNSKVVDASEIKEDNEPTQGKLIVSDSSAEGTTDNEEDNNHEDIDSEDSHEEDKDKEESQKGSDQSSVDGEGHDADDDVVSVDGEDEDAMSVNGEDEDVVSVDGEDHNADDDDVVLVGFVEPPAPVGDSGRFQCPLCRNSYKFKKGLNRHLKKAHPGQHPSTGKYVRPQSSRGQTAAGQSGDASVRAFSCAQCPYKAKKRKDLKKHMVVHSNLKIHKCSVCTFSSKRKYSLRRHLRTHAHSSARMYECALCSFKISSFDSFKAHISIHVTSSTKSCAICGTVIRERTNLIEHIIRHCLGQKTSCRDCETIILRCRKYMRHVLSHKAGSQEHVSAAPSFGQGMASASSSVTHGLPSHKGKSLLNNLSVDADLSELSALISRLSQMTDVASFFSDKSKLVMQLAELSALAAELAVASGNVLQSYNMGGDIHWETPGLAESIEALDFSFVEEFALSSLFSANMAAVKGEYPANLYPAMDTDMQIEVDFNGDAVSCIQQGKRIRQASGAHYQKSKHLLCTHCNMVLHDFCGLKRHLDMHMDIRPHVCEKCGQSFRRKEHLNKHMVTHSIDRPFVCTECHYRTKTKDQLKTHMGCCHAATRAFPCQLCNYGATDSFDLGQHMKRHKPQTCPQCQCVCYSRREFNKHLCTHSSFDCAQCGFSTSVRKEYTKHMRKHSAPCLNCELCGYTTNSTKLFQYHKLRHENRTPYQCPDCEYKCSSRASYRCHRYKHAGLKPFLCSICGASFVKTSHLNRHMLIHKDQKEFKCSMCPYSCRTKHNLKEHEMTHTGEKPYVCMYCSFSFRRKKALMIHMMKHERF